MQSQKSGCGNIILILCGQLQAVRRDALDDFHGFAPLGLFRQCQRQTQFYPHQPGRIFEALLERRLRFRISAHFKVSRPQ